jgi:hypothetical protein
MPGNGVSYLCECLTQVNDPKRGAQLRQRRKRIWTARLMLLFAQPTRDELRRWNRQGKIASGRVKSAILAITVLSI